MARETGCWKYVSDPFSLSPRHFNIHPSPLRPSGKASPTHLSPPMKGSSGACSQLRESEVVYRGHLEGDPGDGWVWDVVPCDGFLGSASLVCVTIFALYVCACHLKSSNDHCTPFIRKFEFTSGCF